MTTPVDRNTSGSEKRVAAHRVRFADINEGKSDFDTVYNAPDPRGYCGKLRRLDYRIPAEAEPIFRSLVHALGVKGRKPVRIVDVGCSYGINAALLKYGVPLNTLYNRYAGPGAVEAPPDQFLKREAAYFEARSEDDSLEVVGIDIAPRALEFADTVGLLDETIGQNLEEGPLSPEGRELVNDADLIISTGCLGYLTDRTFRHIMDAATHQANLPNVASFVLRMFPYAPIADALASYGLATEKLQDATFRQRRFEDDAEERHAITQIRARGLSPDLEADGYYHAEFFLSRPSDSVRKRPLGYLL